MADEPKPASRFGPKLDPTVNYGHLFSAATFLLTAGIAYATLSNRQDEADRRIARLERTQEVMIADNAREAQVIARLDEKINSLNGLLGRLERALDTALSRPAATPPSPTRSGG